MSVDPKYATAHTLERALHSLGLGIYTPPARGAFISSRILLGPDPDLPDRGDTYNMDGCVLYNCVLVGLVPKNAQLVKTRRFSDVAEYLQSLPWPKRLPILTSVLRLTRLTPGLTLDLRALPACVYAPSTPDGTPLEARQLSFAESDLRGLDLSTVARWRDCLFQGVDLSHAKLSTTFDTCMFLGVTIDDADLSGAVFCNCTFGNVDFSTARLDGAAFIGCTFDDRRIPKSQRAAVFVDNDNLTNALPERFGHLLPFLTSHRDPSSSPLSLRGADLRGARISSELVAFFNIDFRDCDFREVVFTNPNANLGFINCNLSGANLSGLKLLYITFSSCILNTTTLSHIQSSIVTFRICELRHVDMRNLRITHSLSFMSCTASHMDLRDSLLTSLSAHPTSTPLGLVDRCAFAAGTPIRTLILRQVGTMPDSEIVFNLEGGLALVELNPLTAKRDGRMSDPTVFENIDIRDATLFGAGKPPEGLFVHNVTSNRRALSVEDWLDEAPLKLAQPAT